MLDLTQMRDKPRVQTGEDVKAARLEGKERNWGILREKEERRLSSLPRLPVEALDFLHAVSRGVRPIIPLKS